MAEKENISCRWQVKLQIKPSLTQSETIDDFNFEVNGGETFVNIFYKTSATDELLPDSSHEFEYADQTIAFGYIASIRELMLARMVYQRVVTPLSVEIVSGPTLINRDELSNASLLKMRNVSSTFTFGRNRLDVGDTLSESTAFWKKEFKSTKSAGHEKDVLRIMDWLQRAEAERDSINRFILSWIAFNGLYGLYASVCGKSNSDDAIEFKLLIDDLLCHEAPVVAKNYGHILNHLETYGILSSKGATNWSAKLKNKRKSVGNEVDILKIATRCIYGVRNQVFHEAPEPENIEERAKQCYKLLSVILLTALRNFVIV